MRFAFTEDQRLFRDAVAELLSRECGGPVVRAAWESETGRAPAVWSQLAEMGVLGAAAPEADGGMGLTPEDLVLLFEESGRAALPEPLVEHAGLVVPLLCEHVDASTRAAILGPLVRGEKTATLGLPGEPLVSHADTADLLLLPRDGGLFAVPRAEAHLERERSVDGARRLFRVSAEGGEPLLHGEAAARALDEAFERAVLYTSAQMIGAGRRCLELAVEYAKVRTQFGKAIGSFQAVQHRLADALVALEMARPVVYRAAWSLTHGAPARRAHVSMARLHAARASRVAGKAALQVHGAIGYSFEHDLHLYMKRAWCLAASLGTERFHEDRVAQWVFEESNSHEPDRLHRRRRPDPGGPPQGRPEPGAPG